MTWLATRIGESRILRVALIALVLGGLITVAALHEPQRTPILSRAEIERANALYLGWLHASQVERCERPALREPATGEGRGDYVGVTSPQSDWETAPLGPCRDALWKVRDEIEEHCKRVPCHLTPLVQLHPHPEVIERCASLLETIEWHAHTTQSCAPIAPENALFEGLHPFNLFDVPRLVRLQIAPLVTQGRVADAARDVTNAMQFVIDYGRNGALISVMIGRASAWNLGRTLEELLADPRMTAGDARSIVRDLDIVFAVPEPFARVMRAEILATTSYTDLNVARDGGITGDRAQDRALMILAHERWLAMYERLCKDTTPAVCAIKLRYVHAVQFGSATYEFEPILESSWDANVVRERIVDQLVADRGIFVEYAQKMAEGDARFAELRARAAARAAQP